MPFRAHWLRLRATSHPTEDEERVMQAVRTVAGLDAEAFRAATATTVLEAHHGGRVLLVETVLRRARDVRSFLDRSIVPADAVRLAAEAAERTDEDGVFHFRLDKQAACAGRLETTQGEDAIKVRLKPEVHPGGRPQAVRAMQEALEARSGR